PKGDRSCCESAVVPGGTYRRSFDGVTMTDATAADATVSAFRLDTYLVTVGRFRAFVAAGPGAAGRPARVCRGHADVPSRGGPRLGARLERVAGRGRWRAGGGEVRRRELDRRRRRPRGPAHELRELVRSLRVLRLGRRLPAHGGRVELRRGRRRRATRVSVV